VDEAVAIATTRHPSMPPRTLQALADKLPRRARVQTLAADDVDELLAETFDDPIERSEDRTAREHALRNLRRACRQLPAAERELIEMRFGRRLSVAAIAALLGEPARPLYRRIDRILVRLRRSIEAMQPAAGASDLRQPCRRPIQPAIVAFAASERESTITS
jgi:RNA polymerase sigma factor for flagellar operon FliA